MKLQLTETANQQFHSLDPEIDYYDLNEYDQLLNDAMLYVEDGYEENEFDDLNEWCISVGSVEYSQTYLNTHPNAVREKIDKMLRENIITIVE
jgi:hypothetical protein